MKWTRVSGSLLVILGTLLSACGPTPTPVVETVVVPGPTQVVTATSAPTPSPQPAPLVICQETEPETLYLYGGSTAARHVWEAIYDGPIDHREYGFQPVILEKLPSLQDGDAYFSTIIVQEGDRVVDATGRPVDLEVGIQVFASHTCTDLGNPDCVTSFEGTPIEMEHMVASWQLLEDLTWSDGEPLTVSDSVYSYEVACHPDTPIRASLLDLCENTASYASAGETTVVWTGLPGYVDDLYFTNFFSPLPRHLWEGQLDYAAADLLTRPESARQPLGWGPFVITEWVEGDHVSLERNPLYFRADEGLPPVEELIFRFADDANDLIAMFLAGQCDVGLLRDGELGRLHGELGEIMPLLVSTEEQGVLDLVLSLSEAWQHLEFGIVPAAGVSRPDFFTDARTRQAIAHCIDRQTLVDEITYGLGQVADVYVPPDHSLFAATRITRWDYDPPAGRELLAQVGWMDEDADGLLEAEDVEGVRRGTVFAVELALVAEDQQQDAIARILRSNLADCGIQVDLVPVPLADFLADGPQGPLLGRQFDLALFHWLNGFEPPCDLYLTEEIPGPENWGCFNISGFSYDVYDGTCRAALAALPGSREYERFHAEAQEILTQELPDLPLFWWVRVALARPGVENLLLDPSEESELWNIESIVPGR
jgi:peptide/nickel transport system substrate-binding protein